MIDKQELPKEVRLGYHYTTGKYKRKVGIGLGELISFE
jgi:hypothetical protein